MATPEQHQLPMRPRSLATEEGEILVSQTPLQSRNTTTALREIHRTGTSEAFEETFVRLDSFARRSLRGEELSDEEVAEERTLTASLQETFGDIGIGKVARAYSFHPSRREQTMQEMREDHAVRITHRPRVSINAYLL